MLALKKELTRIGVTVMENVIADSVDIYLLNSIHFDTNTFIQLKKDKKIKVIHRIDGTIYLSRSDMSFDKLCFDLNKILANITVIQSGWSFSEICKLGYRPVNPIIIPNASDSTIFNLNTKSSFCSSKPKLISTSWSDNMLKGFEIYSWLDRNLDFNRYEYSFVGRSPVKFKNINIIPPKNSSDLANTLRQYDIYITASKIDSCSNAVIEAMSCGLPCIYHDSSGHPELVGFGGIPFLKAEEIPDKINSVCDNYESFRRLICAPSISDIAKRYLDVFKKAKSL